MTKRVFVAMSGGVDSSIAAALLKHQGFAVTGVFMKNWTQPIDQQGRVYCPWREDLESARAAARHLAIPLKLYNFELDYHDKVVSYFYSEYAAGRTPNPDVVCNREIKFGVFLKQALIEGADYIATGHYVRREIRHPSSVFRLLRGVDPNKDQSYFLWAVSPEVLKHCFFPIGDYRKSEVRELARQFGLPNAQRKDSQGICFIGPISVQRFLREQLPEHQGDVRSSTGEFIGSHEGAHFLTIGQRHGVGVATGQPVYVAAKDPVTNTVWVDEDWPGSRLYSSSAVISEINWFDDASWQKLNAGWALSCEVQVRYRQKPVGAIISKIENGDRKTVWKTEEGSPISDISLLVRFHEPVRAVTEGQSLVCYNGDLMLGGGVIAQRG